MKLLILVSVLFSFCSFVPNSNRNIEPGKDLSVRANQFIVGTDIFKLITKQNLDNTTTDYLREKNNSAQINKILAENKLINFCYGITNTSDAVWCLKNNTGMKSSLCSAAQFKVTNFYFFQRLMVVYECSTNVILAVFSLDSY